VEAAEFARETLEIEAQALLDSKARVGEGFNKAVEIILGIAGKLIVVGVGKSGHIGSKIAATLASTGTPSFFLHPAEAMHGDLGMIGKDDAVLAISYSGASEELTKLVPHIKNFGVPVIAMSRSKQSQLGKMSDAHIDISVAKEACPLGIAPTSSTTLTLALGDALAVALMRIRGFKREDFARFHPAGSLGRRLYLKAEHFLIPREQLPIVSTDTPLKDAIVVMSEGKLGNLLVEGSGKLAGVFSDGDLRRSLMRDDFDFNAPVAEYMTKSPFTIESSDILAVDALELIESRRIQLLIVTESKGQIVGAIHIHDLIAAGVERDETK
jgi:arabinose-5-phosphate isomerase